jgi:hypothetical protein
MVGRLDVTKQPVLSVLVMPHVFAHLWVAVSIYQHPALLTGGCRCQARPHRWHMPLEDIVRASGRASRSRLRRVGVEQVSSH